MSGTIYQNEGNEPLLQEIPSHSRVLDCGCGAGDNARLLLDRDCRVVGITINKEEKAIAENWCEEVYLADLARGIPNLAGRCFDVVLMSHILEHLVHPNILLQSAKNVLVPDGFVAVALPNILFYSQRIRFLCGSFDYTESGLLDKTHVRFYTFATGKKLLTQNGYAINKAWASGVFPLWKLRHLLPARWVAALNHAAVRKWPGLFGLQLMYLATVN